MFKDLQKQVKANFNKLAKGHLFYIEVDRDAVWEAYLNGFTDEYRQSNTCNCCKSFLRQFSGIVGISANNEIISIWDDTQADEEYAQSVKNLSTYIHSLPVTDIFLSPFKNCGTEKNLV